MKINVIQLFRVSDFKTYILLVVLTYDTRLTFTMLVYLCTQQTAKIEFWEDILFPLIVIKSVYTLAHKYEIQCLYNYYNNITIV